MIARRSAQRKRALALRSAARLTPAAQERGRRPPAAWLRLRRVRARRCAASARPRTPSFGPGVRARPGCRRHSDAGGAVHKQRPATLVGQSVCRSVCRRSTNRWIDRSGQGRCVVATRREAHLCTQAQSRRWL
eukprot:scaffold3655_cov230-Prasinococcus_capsulatus_cf.AAC.1